MEQTDQQGVEEHRLARTRGAGYKQMRKLGEVADNRSSIGSLANKERQGTARRSGQLFQSWQQRNMYTFGVREVYAHVTRARDVCNEGQTFEGELARQILGDILQA